MPALGGYDQDPINIVGPVRGLLARGRERREQDRQANTVHSQQIERLAMVHQQNMEYLNQSHSNDLARISAKSSSRRSLLRDAGKVLGQMPTDSTLKAGKVSLTRTAPAASPDVAEPVGRHAAGRRKPKTAPPEKLGRHAAGPPPEREPMSVRRPSRHAKP